MRNRPQPNIKWRKGGDNEQEKIHRMIYESGRHDEREAILFLLIGKDDDNA